MILNLEQVPYLSVRVAGVDFAEFYFRGALGRMQRCELGLCMSLAFPQRVDHLLQMQRVSLLLASSGQTLDFGLQNDGDHWLLWRRHEPGVLHSPQAVQRALEDLLTVMRFLYHRFFTNKNSHRPGKSYKLFGQFA